MAFKVGKKFWELIDAIKSKTFKLGVKENLEILGV
jgi:hypothetical protein